MLLLHAPECHDESSNGAVTGEEGDGSTFKFVLRHVNHTRALVDKKFGFLLRHVQELDTRMFCTNQLILRFSLCIFLSEII